MCGKVSTLLCICSSFSIFLCPAKEFYATATVTAIGHRADIGCRILDCERRRQHAYTGIWLLFQWFLLFTLPSPCVTMLFLHVTLRTLRAHREFSLLSTSDPTAWFLEAATKGGSSTVVIARAFVCVCVRSCMYGCLRTCVCVCINPDSTPSPKALLGATELCGLFSS